MVERTVYRRSQWRQKSRLDSRSAETTMRLKTWIKTLMSNNSAIGLPNVVTTHNFLSHLLFTSRSSIPSHCQIIWMNRPTSIISFPITKPRISYICPPAGYLMFSHSQALMLLSVLSWLGREELFGYCRHCVHIALELTRRFHYPKTYGCL